MSAAASPGASPGTRNGTASRRTGSASSTPGRAPASGSGATTDLRLTGRLADGEADDYPDASGGPVYGSGELRHTTHRDLALGAQLGTGDPAGRRHRLSVGLSRRERDRTEPRGAPAGSGVERAGHVHAAPPLVAGAAPPDVADRGGRRGLGRRGVGRERERPRAAALPGRRRARRLPEDALERRGLRGHSAPGALGGGRGSVLLEAALRADVATTDSGPAQPARRAGRPPRRRDDPRLRASAGRASKLPSFFALASPRALGGNPDLRPESAWGGEAGIEHDFRAARLSVGAAYFLQRYGTWWTSTSSSSCT